MRMKALFMILLAVLLAACSSGGAKTAATPPPTIVTTDDGPALLPVGTTGASGPSAVAEPTTAGAVPALPTSTPTGLDYPSAPEEPALPPGYPDAPSLPSGYPDLSASMTPVVAGPITPSPEQERLIEGAARDLSSNADVPMDEIKLVSAVSVTWPDGALGCPEAGMTYIQVQIEGLLITLGAGGKEYTYHTDDAKNYVFCRDGVPLSSGSLP